MIPTYFTWFTINLLFIMLLRLFEVVWPWLLCNVMSIFLHFRNSNTFIGQKTSEQYKSGADGNHSQVSGGGGKSLQGDINHFSKI